MERTVSHSSDGGGCGGLALAKREAPPQFWQIGLQPTLNGLFKYGKEPEKPKFSIEISQCSKFGAGQSKHVFRWGPEKKHVGPMPET